MTAESPGNASKITTHIFRIFDSDGNDYLDFKEFLMAIDVANRETGLSPAFYLDLSNSIEKVHYVDREVLGVLPTSHGCYLCHIGPVRIYAV